MVKGAVNLAKQGVSSIANAGLKPLLDRLKGVVLPLLRRVIETALNRLPTSIRPIAQKVAHKLFGIVVNETESSNNLSNAVSSQAIQQEFDMQLADLLLSGESFTEYIPSNNAELDEAYSGSTFNIQAAREQFINEFNRLERGQDPQPIIQNFLPAALIALQPVIKTVISMIGRPRVVEFIAGLLAKLVEQWVGPEAAKALATPVADVGLGFLGLETGSTNHSVVTSQLIAEVIENTLLELSQLSPVVFENNVMLEAEVREAFEKSAASYFPDAFIKPELRETAQVTGSWVSMPLSQKRKYYRKYSKIFDVELTKQIVDQVKIFGNATLGDFLRDVLLLPLSKPIRVKVHLYELALGSRLVDIAIRESRVSGLGVTSWKAWSQIHPLTVEAATALLKEPGLAKPIKPEYLAGPYLTAVGQRFFYLEIPGAISPPVVADKQHNCINRTNVTINLKDANIKVRLQFSER